MQFTDPERVQTRARAVLDLLPTTVSPRLTHSQTRVQVGEGLRGIVIFNALDGRVQFNDADGEERVIELPEGVTSEAVAAVTFALTEVADWS